RAAARHVPGHRRVRRDRRVLRVGAVLHGPDERWCGVDRAAAGRQHTRHARRHPARGARHGRRRPRRVPGRDVLGVPAGGLVTARHARPRARRLVAPLVLALVVALGLGSQAFWTVDSLVGGHGAAAAGTVGAGSTPTVVVDGTSATLTWTAGTLAS